MNKKKCPILNSENSLTEKKFCLHRKILWSHFKRYLKKNCDDNLKKKQKMFIRWKYLEIIFKHFKQGCFYQTIYNNI